MALKECSCLVEYEKNLLISALAAYKAEIEKSLPTLLGMGTTSRPIFSRKGLDKTSESLLLLFQRRASNIDKLVQKIEDTPECPETPEKSEEEYKETERYHPNR